MLERKIKELSLLFEISRILDRSMDLRDTVGPALEAMAEQMGMIRGTITLLNRETGEIYIDVAHNLSERQIERGRYKPGEGVTGTVVNTGLPMVAPHIAEDPRFLDRTGARKGLDKRDISFLCVPIKLGNDVLGALSADRLFESMEALDEDVRLLTIIASMIAQAAHLRRSSEEERLRLIEENRRLKDQLQERFKPSNIIGSSKAMQVVYDLIAQVCGSDATALIRGESGTGKELVANAIHYNSPRAEKPFIKVNCGALPESLIESELFGHVKGAFTGAVSSRRGRFELAEGGTIFLDEVGDLSPAIQVKLLRVLQEREFERLGGSAVIKADVRVIAATNRDLESLCREGKFRQDLYYRLNVFPIPVPPLRDRKTDIPLLADHFVEKYAAKNHKSVERISTPAIDMLMSYHWPGNVRELENCMERAVLLSTESVIHARHLPPTLQTPKSGGALHIGTLRATLEYVERDLIYDALKASRGNMAKAARSLGLTERVMGLRVKRYGIDPVRFRTRMLGLRSKATKM
jgi:Nif-specific regulatory protein